LRILLSVLTRAEELLGIAAIPSAERNRCPVIRTVDHIECS
jgi:hypothetical protein